MNDERTTALERIKKWKEMYDKVKDRSTMAYLQLLDSMRHDYEVVKYEHECLKICKEIEEFCVMTKLEDASATDIMLAAYDTRARLGDFRAYCIALEWNRPIERQFYLPRRRILEKHGLIQAFQDLSDDKLDFLCLNLPPRIGKSTMSLFFLTFRAGLFPDQAILGNGHSTALTQSFYEEVLNIMTSEEYRYNQIFPNNKVVKKSAEYSWIDLNKEKRFHTLTFKSVDGGTTGLAEASNLLYCDDLVKDVETANNPDRLEKLFYTYTSTIQDRKVQRLCKDGEYRPCPELHVNTPWSINDVTNRLIALYGDDGRNPRVRIISVPCYDEHGESNFMYDYGKGFNADYYHQLQKSEDPVIFSAKYLMKCIEREGRPFTADQLNFFYELPEGEPDRIVCYSDVAHGGDDYFSMPIAYVYGNEAYIEDVLFVNKLDDDKTRPLVVNKIIEHKVQRAGFEENNGGKLYADLIAIDLKRRQYRCNITTHKVPTTKSKRDRILSCQSEIKGIADEFGTYRIYFKAYDVRKDNNEYNTFMLNLSNWSQKDGIIQKKQHDDAPDSLAGLITNILSGKLMGKAKSISASKYGI